MQPSTVHLFVFDTLADWEASYAIAGLNNPAFPTRGGPFRVRTVGLDRSPVITMGGLTIVPDMVLAELEPTESAMLILPGGTAWDAGELSAVTPHVARVLGAGVPIAAICGATAGLARAGMLDEVKHTSNAREYLQATQYCGGALYQDALAVTDSNVITAGATGALEFAGQIFRRLGVYPDAVLAAWYALFKRGDASQFAQLQALAAAEGTA